MRKGQRFDELFDAAHVASVTIPVDSLDLGGDGNEQRRYVGKTGLDLGLDIGREFWVDFANTVLGRGRFVCQWQALICLGCPGSEPARTYR